MAEPLKNMISRALIEPVANEIYSVWNDFDQHTFLQNVFNSEWETRELKDRIRHVAFTLGHSLPRDYPSALHIMTRVTQGYIDKKGEQLGFQYGFFPQFVEIFGIEYPELSLPAIETMTRWSTAEFAIRPFLLRYPTQTYQQMLDWTRHESPLVRRLASEGFRPRLPWGMGVPALKKDPTPVLAVLEALKDDPAETVRRSVANNLNDISKDHPEIVIELTKRWAGISKETDWILKHANRGLLKRGNSTALAHFGFGQNTDSLVVEGFQCDAAVQIGDRLSFNATLLNQGANSLQIRIEYAIDYITGSGKKSHKVFKIKEITLDAGCVTSINKYQRFEDFTTRKHYSGAHQLALLVNGKVMCSAPFDVRE